MFQPPIDAPRIAYAKAVRGVLFSMSCLRKDSIASQRAHPQMQSLPPSLLLVFETIDMLPATICIRSSL